MKSILLFAMILSTSLAWAGAPPPIFLCNDSSFSWDRIEVSDFGDKFRIRLHSGYNQSFSLNPFLGKQNMSGDGTITVAKTSCGFRAENPNLMLCKDAPMEINLTLHNRTLSEDVVIIESTAKATLMLNQVNLIQLKEDGSINKRRSAKVSVAISDPEAENRSFGIQVDCVRQAF